MHSKNKKPIKKLLVLWPDPSFLLKKRVMVLSRVLRSFIMSVIYAQDEMGARQPLGIGIGDRG